MIWIIDYNKGMGILDRLERKIGWFAIPHLTQVIIVGQAFVFLASLAGKLHLGNIILIPDLVLAGEYRRLLTFIFIPPDAHPLFLAFAWYLFYMMGTALEEQWGEFRYTFFLLTAYLATVGVSFLMPHQPATNSFIAGSIFLAFAFLYPNFELYLFFVLPVKIKWLAMLTAFGYGWMLVFGSWRDRLLTLAGIVNVLIFFRREIAHLVKLDGRKLLQESRALQSKKAFHRCAVCGRTDLTDPQLEFRYCSRCGGAGYCADHIRDHAHAAPGE